MLERMIPGPLAVTGTAERVRSVRLWRRLRKTPVRVLKEWTAEKERRLEAREGGRWKGVGREGQFWKWREVRVEREVRAVVERWREREQLERERERRWRNGEELSQRAVVWGGEQGSLEVGMLRDWRAVSCLGSRVVEVGEDLEEWGGDVVGEGEEEGDGEEGDLVGEGEEGDLDLVGEGEEGDLVGEMVVCVGALGGEREEGNEGKGRRRRRRREREIGRNGGGGAIGRAREREREV